MAVANGTIAADFIHRLGDGFSTGGLNEVMGVTAAADVINGDVGSDLIFGDAGNATINGIDGSDTLVGVQGADRLLGEVGNDVFRILQTSDISGLAETVNSGNDFETLDFPTIGATGPVGLSFATNLDVEQLLSVGNDISMTSAQLGNFLSISGTFLAERLILTDGGLVDLTGASLA